VTSERRKLRWAWVGLGTYFLIFLNAIRYASRVPYQIFILGALLNAAIITVLILAMRRAYRRLRNAPRDPRSDQLSHHGFCRTGRSSSWFSTRKDISGVLVLYRTVTPFPSRWRVGSPSNPHPPRFCGCTTLRGVGEGWVFSVLRSRFPPS